MATIHTASLQLGTLAHEALEIFTEHATHTATCKQCRVDRSFCDAGKRYEYNFHAAYQRWMHARPRTGP